MKIGSVVCEHSKCRAGNRFMDSTDAMAENMNPSLAAVGPDLATRNLLDLV